MARGIRSHFLNFEVLDTGNTKTLVFLDSSEYFENPETPLLEVTLPGARKYFLVNVAARKVNTFNANTLGLTAVLNNESLIDLPDGVYTLTYKICPYKYLNRTKYFLRATKLHQDINRLLDDLEESDCVMREEKKLKMESVEIFLLIESAKASAELNHPEKASDKYQQAAKRVAVLLKKILNQH